MCDALTSASSTTDTDQLLELRAFHVAGRRAGRGVTQAVAHGAAVILGFQIVRLYVKQQFSLEK